MRLPAETPRAATSRAGTPIRTAAVVRSAIRHDPVTLFSREFTGCSLRFQMGLQFAHQPGQHGMRKITSMRRLDIDDLLDRPRCSGEHDQTVRKGQRVREIVGYQQNRRTGTCARRMKLSRHDSTRLIYPYIDRL